MRCELSCLMSSIVMSIRRAIKRIWKSKPTVEGAGVRLKRVFGYPEVPQCDPFLLLDDFHSDNPSDYLSGFPWHPHRGIETVTYMLSGHVRHGDGMGNRGVVGSGDVQWMTAGSGIVHEEMPEKDNGLLWGLQLWVNLPASHKMMAPRYQDIPRTQIPEVILSNQIRVRVVCGSMNGTAGPVQDLVVDPEFLDITVPAGVEFVHQVKDGYTVFAYVLEGEGFFDEERSQHIPEETFVLFEKQGTRIRVMTEDTSVRFLLISGKPLEEPVAWYGPIVMNTKEELELAFQEYRSGDFIKHNKKGE